MVNMITGKSDWNRLRVPASSEANERVRVTSYWSWLSTVLDDVRAVEPAIPLDTDENGFSIVALQNSADADWEASYMEHSIGYSWDHYSRFGEIYGLRGSDGLPVATILVTGNNIVHARERRNARLGPDAQAAMEEFATAQGWKIKPDRLAFEAWVDPLAGAVCVAYMARSEGRPVCFGEVILQGPADEKDLAALVEALDGGAVFSAENACIPALNGFDDEPHEIMSVTSTNMAPNSRISLGDMVELLNMNSTSSPSP